MKPIKKHHMRTLFAALLLLVSIAIKAQDQPQRTFAFDGMVGGTTSPHFNVLAPNGLSMPEKVHAGNGLHTKLRAEYYLPNTPLSIKLGYEHEEWNFLDTNLGKDMALVSLGARCYPGRKAWNVQPYVGVDGMYNFNGGHYPFIRTRSDDRYGTVGYDGMANIPRFNVAPIVGADIYLFSSIALQLEYGCRIGFAKQSTIAAHYSHIAEPFEIRLSPIRHSFNVGLKVVFPFSFTAEDGGKAVQGLLGILFEMLFHTEEKRYYYND